MALQAMVDNPILSVEKIEEILGSSEFVVINVYHNTKN